MKNILLLASKNPAFLLRKNVKFILILLLFLFPYPYSLIPTHAAESTPSAADKSKLEQLKKDIASKAAKLKAEISQKLQNRAFVGFIKNKSSNSLTLASLKGVKIVEFTQDTIFESRIKKRAEVKTLKEEDFVAALGDIDDTGVLSAKKIILLPSPSNQPKTYLWGQIISLSDDLTTIRDKDFKNVAISINKKTTTPTLSNGNLVIVVGLMNENSILEASFLHVLQAATSSAKKK